MRAVRVRGPRRALALLASWALVAVACGDSPSAPTPPGGTTVTGVTVTASGATTAPTFRLVANARHADGSTEDVTAPATWESSDPQIATVAAGTVTALRDGEVDIRATYQGQTGSLHVQVTHAVVSDLTITGAVVGPSFPLTAMVHYGDGSTADVTTAATWDTSNAQIATVSASGVVSVVASGQVEIRATYRGVTARRAIDVTTVSFSIIGLVREAAPGTAPVAGASVRLLDAQAPAVATDAAGGFIFRYVPAGRFLLEITKAGFETWYGDGTLTSGDVRVTAALYPIPPVNGSGAKATARCQDGTWSWGATPGEACAANGGVAYGVCPGPLCTAVPRPTFSR